MVFSFDAVRGFYRASRDPDYFFTAPAWLRYFVRGLDCHGRELFWEYLLNSVPFEADDSIVETGGNDGDFSLALKQLGLRFSLDSF